MQSKKINELGTNVAPSVNDLTVVGDAATGQLKKITLSQISSLFGSTGSVSSVAMTVPTGLSISGTPITTSGTLALTFTSGYSIPTTAKQTEWDAGYAERLKWDGGTSGLNAATARTSLGLVIGTDVLAYRTFGTAANNNTGDFATAAQGTNADTAYSLRLTGASLPLSISSNVISIAQSSSTISGFLSSTDWNTFNGKQQALNGTGFVKALGTSITYDNSTYYLASNPTGYITSSALSSYLPLSGGTLTGALSITNADQSGSRLVIQNTGTGGQAVNLIAGNPNVDQTGFSIAYGNTNFLRFTSTGAATFSSSLNATSAIFSGAGQSLQLTSASDVYLNVTRGSSILNIGNDATGSFYNTNTSHRFFTNSGTITALTIAATGAATFTGLVTNYNVYNTQTASYTLVLADASKIIEMNVGSANTVTIPTNASVAFPIGTEITVLQYGAGITSIAVASGVTIVSKDNANIIANRYSGVTLIKRATNEWYLIGNIIV